MHSLYAIDRESKITDMITFIQLDRFDPTFSKIEVCKIYHNNILVSNEKKWNTIRNNLIEYRNRLLNEDKTMIYSNASRCLNQITQIMDTYNMSIYIILEKQGRRFQYISNNYEL